MSPAKERIRRSVWDDLEESGEARFPFPPHGRIPNFAGSAEAASRLTTLARWEEATVLKANPDAPQRHVRERALAAGKTVVMAAPRLRAERPFVVIEPGVVDDPGDAATIGGAETYGDPRRLEGVPDIDAVVVGSVAVDRSGGRVGKGEGYSDLEFALLLDAGLIDREVTVATTVHDRQVVPDALPQDDHDVPVDLIVTPTTVVRAESRDDRPDGIDWDTLDPERLGEIPALRERAPG